MMASEQAETCRFINIQAINQLCFDVLYRFTSVLWQYSGPALWPCIARAFGGAGANPKKNKNNWQVVASDCTNHVCVPSGDVEESFCMLQIYPHLNAISSRSQCPRIGCRSNGSGGRTCRVCSLTPRRSNLCAYVSKGFFFFVPGKSVNYIIRESRWQLAIYRCDFLLFILDIGYCRQNCTVHSKGCLVCIQGLSKRFEQFKFGIFYVLIVKIRYNFTHK